MRGLGARSVYGVEVHANVVQEALRVQLMDPEESAAEDFWIYLVSVGQDLFERVIW